MRKTETKDFKFTLAEIDEKEGTFRGYASVWEETDSYGDRVMKGAFKRSLKAQRTFPMLWSHNITEPIGVISGAEDDTGLAVEGAINLDVQRGREVRSLMKQGAVQGLSIGYQTVLDEVDKESGARKLKEVKLWEISPVVFQACPGALVSDIKAATEADSNEPAALPESDPGRPTRAGEAQGIEANPETFHFARKLRDAIAEIKRSMEAT